MTLNDFRTSLSVAEPPAQLTSAARIGLWWDGKGDWKRAHKSAQQDEGPEGSRVYAYDPRQRTGGMLQMRGESRRSTRVPLKVVISAKGLNQPLTCGGETMVVNRHGALVCCTVPLRMGLEIEVHVIITDKRAAAKVVYVDTERPFVCGIALDKPENIWGLSFPPDDWDETHET